MIKRPLRKKKINRQDKKYLTNERYKIKFKQKNLNKIKEFQTKETRRQQTLLSV